MPKSNRRPYTTGTEIFRWVLLVGIAFWLSHGYFEPRLIGTPDALWYHHLLADVVTQFRAGVFPVYVGQSDYSFNGSVYPLRAAPYFQYLAGLIDLVTFRSLGFFALQHLTIVVSMLAGALITYGALLWVALRDRWMAFALTMLYLMCPGVVGLFYAQDLYMSGMTIPWVPLAFAALVRSFDDSGLTPKAVLALSLAALWWAHSPIALWATLICALGQVIRLFVGPRGRTDLSRSALAAGIFCVLAFYPILSVFLLRSRGESIVPYIMDRRLLLQWVQGSFPSSIEPLDINAPGVSHLQLGYGLWIVFIGSVVASIFKARVWAVGVLLAAAMFLLMLVFPVPWITRELWYKFPETLVGMTLYWPMQRFYIIVAGATVVCAQRIAAEWSPRRPSTRSALVASLVLATFWSAWEASKLIQKAKLQPNTVEDSRLWALTENVAVQRHTYGLFARRPAYFTHGVVDPRMEAHLLDPETGKILASDYDLARASPTNEDFRGTTDVNPGILDLEPSLTLRPGYRFLLTFDFAKSGTAGILQMIGPDFFREYELPQSGESKAFGSLPGNVKSIVVWTSMPADETVRLRFIPTSANSKPIDYVPFAKFSLEPIDTKALPIFVKSLIPYSAVVRSPKKGFLETPRMFVPGYAAEVDGTPVEVRRSSEGLVEFLVPAGESHVVLRFVGSWELRASFWLSSIGWIAAVFCGLYYLKVGPGKVACEDRPL